MVAEIYAESILIEGKTTTIFWSDGVRTEATPSGKDKFSVDLGVLWAISKRFISTSKIVHAVFTATYFLGMTEGEMLWIVATKFLPEKEVEGVINFAKTL